MSKTPLIFIHGYRGNHLGLADVAKEFEKDYDVHSPDLPPAGGHKFEKYTADTYADALAEYIKKHKLSRPVLIGHSLGSIIATATAEKYPELINQKLILLAPISKKPAKFFGRLTPLTVLLPRRLVDFITTVFLFVPHDFKLFKKSLKTTHECSKDFVSRRDVMKAGTFSAAHSIADFNFKNDTILIAGEKDRLIPQKSTRQLAKDRGFKLDIIKGTGHLLNYEVPTKTAAAIRNFLEK